MTPSEEARALRRRHDALRDDLDRVDGPNEPFGPTILVQTQTVATYPTVAQRAYAVKRVIESGAETEGAAVVLTTTGGVFYALGVGTAIPTAGSLLLATLASGRYVFQVDS